MRKCYLDNIRWLLVFAVVPLHVFFVSNDSGVVGTMPGMHNIKIMDLLALGLCNPWMMAMICLISGMAARYSLQKRSHKQFFLDRVDKLLVPGTLGVLLYQCISAYLYISVGIVDPSYAGTHTGPIALFIRHIILAFVSGTGPLWVAQVLFVCCCILLVIRKIDKNDKLWDICGKINFLGLVLLFLVIWVAALALDFPIKEAALYRYRLGTNLTAFLIGYYVISHEKIQELVERKSRLLSFLAILSTVIYSGYLVVGSLSMGGSDSVSLSRKILTVWYLWIVILAIIGFAKKHFNNETAFTRYMSKISYGLLMVHYPILLFLSVVIPPLGLPVVLNHLLVMVLEIILSFAAYELLKRIPIVRYCIFGYRKKE